MRRIVKWSVIPVVAAAGVAAWSQFGRGDTQPAPAVETARVDRGSIVSRITATGTVSPLKTVQVGSQVSGRISEIDADFNSRVTKGMVIARIDPQLFKAAVDRAQANLSAARADLTRARALAADSARQSERSKQLQEKGIISAAEADTAAATARAQQAQVVSAKAAVEQATAALDEAKLNVASTTIYSPIDGTVISRSVDVGQTVAASLQAPTLFTIAEDLTKMQVDTSVSESDVGKLAAGQSVSFTVDAFPEQRFRGTVRQIRNAPTTVQNVVTYNAVIDVDNPDLLLRPGMTASATFIVGQAKDALRVPNAALRYQQTPGKKTVWKLDGKQEVPVEVTLGLTDGARTAVLSGALAENDVIVTGGEAGAQPRPQAAARTGGGGRRARSPF